MLRTILLGAMIMFAPNAWSLQADETSKALHAVLEAQDESAKARYAARHPGETLRFFGIQPGMQVAEALPGGGWYSKILIPYLGTEGGLLGLDYAMDMWPHFGGFATAEFIEKRASWPSTWPQQAAEWGGEDGASVSAATFGTLSDDSAGSLDAVLFIRALHNLARFEDKGSYLTNALKDAYTVLKPGGVVGVVQHQAREDRSDEWANGSNGYLKKSFVIAQMEKAGFELDSEFEINENANDQAKEGDVVWRLPPSLGDSKDDEERKQAMLAIGESHRMTLLFRKPAS